jgi:ATP-dependent DNA helicase RecQ
MKDQTDKLQQRGIRAVQVNSALSAGESREALDALAGDRVEFVLTTPERLADEEFLDMLGRKTVDVFVVDEAHCVSQWGHDFRPSYLALPRAIDKLGRPPVLAMTATAPPDVLNDILSRLGIEDATIVNTGIYRENLALEVKAAASDTEKQAEVVRLLRDMEGTGIVYAATVKHVEEIVSVLRGEGLPVARYHGRLQRQERHDNQDRFMRGELKAMVATNAFGMGVDKPDIRFIIHYDMPASLDAYYQEAGRAGRDGGPARCVLLFRREDRNTHTFLMRGRYPSAEQIAAVQAARREITDGRITIDGVHERSHVPKTKVRVILSQLKQQRVARTASSDAVQAIARYYENRRDNDRRKLEQMQIYAQTALCRWNNVLAYFGDPPVEGECGHCDNCTRSRAAASAPATKNTANSTSTAAAPAAGTSHT